MALWCWHDAWVYRQCCDTAYGPSGLGFCFAQPGLSFGACCPPPPDLDRPDPRKLKQIVLPWWEGDEKRGCSSRFYWLPSELATSLSFGTAYDLRTGEVLVEQKDTNATASREATRVALTKHLFENKDLSFGRLQRGAASYYESGHLRIEIAQILNEVLTHFGESLHECAEATILAVFMKTEALFDRDRIFASKLADWVRRLLLQAVRARRVRPPEEWTAQPALARLDQLERRPQRVEALSVDLVVPLCSAVDVAALARGLEQSLGELHEVSMSAPWHARLTLHLYDICGLLAAASRADSLAGQLSEALFGGLPARALQLFDPAFLPGGPLPLARIGAIEEDVPTGDVAAYLRHLADASSAGTLADVTLLLHADFAEHVRPRVLEQVFGGLGSGAWPHDEVDFLYLGWRHDGPVQADGQRVASTVRCHCSIVRGKLGLCRGSPRQPLDRGAEFGDFNAELLQNLWRLTFGRPFDPISDDFGGGPSSGVRPPSGTAARSWSRSGARSSCCQARVSYPGGWTCRLRTVSTRACASGLSTCGTCSSRNASSRTRLRGGPSTSVPSRASATPPCPSACVSGALYRTASCRGTTG
mmetsp:Transcript_47235/g.151607  ORF Transcript_47235/g.151607 Transcript_47235/m.151607 type:complete len:590 (-) Transcript_47235:165-1934(-)